MKKIIKVLLFFQIILISILHANILQEAINNAPKNSILKLPDGIYSGNIKINKPLYIIGASKNTIINGDKKNSVIQITSSNVTLKNITIKNSGERLENTDSAIKISQAKNIVIENCTIKDSLYGIDAYMLEDSIIKNNNITSYNKDISLRGDAIKLFYSKNNSIINNRIDKSKDVYFLYSNNNLYKANHITNSRYGIHLENSHNNQLQQNSFISNSVGIIITGAKNTNIFKNIIKSSKGFSAIGLLIKGVSNFKFHDNVVSYNSKAFYIDAKHNETSLQRFITNNEISYNIEAFHFHGAIKQNLIKHNTIIGNIEDVAKSTRGNITSQNIVEYNYWDHYTGFDKDRNNIGDTTYKIFLYSDKLWNHNNKIKFFYASALISLIDFVFKLAPFVEPVLLLEDKHPLIEQKRQNTLTVEG